MSDFSARVTNAVIPGNFFVDFFPLMKFLPTCVAKWKREGLAWNNTQSKFFEDCAAGVADKMVSRPVPCCKLPYHQPNCDMQARGETQKGFVARLLTAADQLSRKELTWLPGVLA